MIVYLRAEKGYRDLFMVKKSLKMSKGLRRRISRISCITTKFLDSSFLGIELHYTIPREFEKKLESSPTCLIESILQ